MKRIYLGELEELVMLAVASLQKQAYGVAVMDELLSRIGRKVTISTIHETLARLEKKGFLESYMGGATNERGGRKKRFFEVTAYGVKAMNEARVMREQFWQLIPKTLWQMN